MALLARLRDKWKAGPTQLKERDFGNLKTLEDSVRADHPTMVQRDQCVTRPHSTFATYPADWTAYWDVQARDGGEHVYRRTYQDYELDVENDARRDVLDKRYRAGILSEAQLPEYIRVGGTGVRGIPLATTWPAYQIFAQTVLSEKNVWTPSFTEDQFNRLLAMEKQRKRRKQSVYKLLGKFTSWADYCQQWDKYQLELVSGFFANVPDADGESDADGDSEKEADGESHA